MRIASYKDLIVWQRSIELVVAIYHCTEKFPPEEKYGLAMQMKRAAVSIPSNIAEGSRRGSRKEFRNFLFIAYGSGAELETQITIAKQLSFCRKLNFKGVDSLLNEIMRMLNKLIHEFKQ